MVNNLDWLGELRLIDFLRDTGKHFTIPYMLAKDSVQVRLDRGLSFTEFSYMLLQAYDFAHLHRDDGRRAPDGRRRPMGQHHRRAGADPADPPAPTTRHGSRPRAWPTSSVDARRAPSSARARAASRSGSTRPGPSPYAFYQYWLNTDDRDVGTYLRWFTEFSREEIEALEAEAARAPEGSAGPARAGPRHHGADARRGGGGPGDRRFRGPVRGRLDRRSGRARVRSSRAVAGSRSTRETLAAGIAVLLPRRACSRRAVTRGGRSPGAA